MLRVPLLLVAGIANRAHKQGRLQSGRGNVQETAGHEKAFGRRHGRLAQRVVDVGVFGHHDLVLIHGARHKANVAEVQHRR